MKLQIISLHMEKQLRPKLPIVQIKIICAWDMSCTTPNFLLN